MGQPVPRLWLARERVVVVANATGTAAGVTTLYPAGAILIFIVLDHTVFV